MTFWASSRSLPRRPACDQRSFVTITSSAVGIGMSRSEDALAPAAGKAFASCASSLNKNNSTTKGLSAKSQHIAVRERHGLELNLTIQLKRWAKASCQRRNRPGFQLHDEVGVLRGPRNRVVVARERADQHVGNCEGIQRRR